MRTQSSRSKAFQKLNYNKLKIPNAHSNPCSLNFNLQKGGEYGNASFRVGRFSFQGLGEHSKQDLTSDALNHPHFSPCLHQPSKTLRMAWLPRLKLISLQFPCSPFKLFRLWIEILVLNAFFLRCQSRLLSITLLRRKRTFACPDQLNIPTPPPEGKKKPTASNSQTADHT